VLVFNDFVILGNVDKAAFCRVEWDECVLFGKEYRKRNWVYTLKKRRFSSSAKQQACK